MRQERQRLPDDRESVTRRFEVTWPNGDVLRFYVIVDLYEDGRPGGISIHGSRMGAHAYGLLGLLAMAASLALQYGASIETITHEWRRTNFIPNGFTGDREYRSCSSICDLMAQWLEDRFVKGRTNDGTSKTSE